MTARGVPVDVGAAERFVRLNARWLDVVRFERAFGDGGDDAVVRALLAYRNDDGGFAGLLEPDLRTPRSQPQAAELALRIFDELGHVPADVAGALCDWLETVTDADGGVPFTHPSAQGHPAAPHWHHADGVTGAINPTAPLVGLLHRLGIVGHPWVDRATGFCWTRLADETVPLEMYDVRAGVWLLDPSVPEAPASAAARARLRAAAVEHVALDPADTAPDATEHRIGPLAVAPRPTIPGHDLFPAAVLGEHVDALAAQQQPDGGWEVNFPPISPAAHAEWRGWSTVDALLTLRDAGRLD